MYLHTAQEFALRVFFHQGSEAVICFSQPLRR
jgi:hypothetical protein